ncbi:MAG: YeeE/YedE family protein [Giesbergeria sp.]|nr:YeeE/YedE family protein [Giesbergeria sp.]
MNGERMSLPRFLAVLLAGALFGFGLALSTMVQPEVVLGFLRFEDFGLVLVMGGAVVVTLLAYKLAPRLLSRPLLGGNFGTHPSTWNRDTALGSALFGVGWGLCGVCPGPAIAGLGTGNWTLLWALGGIALGALVQGLRAR